VRQALDALDEQVVMEVSRQSQGPALALVKRRGLTIVGKLRPGNAGLALEAPPAAPRLFGVTRIGLDCTPGLNLSPHKSVSVVYGVGFDLPATSWSRCDDCRWRETCCARSDR
jgi:hypothetical protein